MSKSVAQEQINSVIEKCLWELEGYLLQNTKE